MTTELINFINWQATQSQGWGLTTFGEVWKKNNIDPFTDRLVLRNAFEALARDARRMAIIPSYKPEYFGDWVAAQAAAKKITDDAAEAMRLADNGTVVPGPV